MQNKNNDPLVLDFFLLLLLSFYLGMSKFTTYLKQVESGIQMILNESKDHILLPPELNPLENKLNEIKRNIERAATDRRGK